MPENPNWRREIEVRLAGLNLPLGREAEIIDELACHLNDEYRRLLAGGASEAEAVEIALEDFNGRPSLAEEIRSVERKAPAEMVVFGAQRNGAGGDLWRDLCYSFRVLKCNPSFTAIAVLSLALGIGGNAAMFSMVNTVLIRPLPYKDSHRLVHAANSGQYPPGGLVQLQHQSRTMDLAGYNSGIELNLTGLGEPLRLRGSSISANLFNILGAGVELGRSFQPGEDRAGRDNVVILSEAFWRDRFNSDPKAVGRVITLGGINREVVGIATRGFAFPDSTTAFWIPLHLDPRDPVAYWARGFMPVIGRLRDRVTLDQAQHEIASLSLQMLQSFPYPMGQDWAAKMTVLPLHQYLTSDVRTKLLVLQCAVALVLLIACANIGGLLLARATSRQKEIALRVALGASRSRIIRQLLTESLVLAILGGLLGILLAFTGDSVLQSIVPGVPRDLPAWQIVIFVCALSLITGTLFGFVPALVTSRQDLACSIKTGRQRAAGEARSGVRSALIVTEIALAVVLTISAGLLIRSLWKLSQVNPGFQSQHLLTLRVSPNQALCADRAACIALYNELLRRTQVIPGVQDATAANTIPLAANIPSSAVRVEGLPYVPAERTAPLFWGRCDTRLFPHNGHSYPRRAGI